MHAYVMHNYAWAFLLMFNLFLIVTNNPNHQINLGICCINSSLPGQNGRHFVDDNFKCICMNESFVFWLKSHWSLLLRVQLTITQHHGLAPNRRRAIIWTNADSINWRIYATLSLLCMVSLSLSIYIYVYIYIYIYEHDSMACVSALGEWHELYVRFVYIMHTTVINYTSWINR